MRLIITSILITLLLASKAGSQFRLSPSETFAEAFDFFSYEEYDEALPLFLSLLRRDESNSHLQYLTGICYLNSEGQKQRALKYLERAAGSISLEHRTGVFEDITVPVDCFYYLGLAYRMAYRFDESLESFKMLKGKVGDRYDLDPVEHEITITKNAAHFFRNRHNIKIIDDIELPATDALHKNVIISGDESTVVYSEQQKFYDAVFFTRDIGDGWTRPANITMQLGSDGMAYPVSLSYDGHELYLYQYDGFSNTNLYVSRFTENSWSAMEKLSNNINSSSFEQYASITKDGQVLYFSSDRVSGRGGFDIYRSVKDDNMGWGQAQNLGYPVNTVSDESYPYISPDGNILFFSSKGHTGIGGYDIFISVKSESGEWSPPRNLGFPVNTPDDDAIFIPVNNGKSAYFSMRTEENNDIREFRKIESFDVDMSSSAIAGISVKPEPSIPGHVPSFEISLHQISPQENIIASSSIEEDQYKEYNLSWGNYLIEFKHEDYTKKTIPFTIPEYYPEDKYDITAVLFAKDPDKISTEPVQEIPDTLIIDKEPILFGFDSKELDEKYIPMVTRAAELLNDFDEAGIELKGYTDALGPAAYNEYLAGLRSETVAEALEQRGVDMDRITIAAVGMENYVARNTTPDGRDNPEGRRYNRRVELLFTGLPGHIIIRDILIIPEHLKID